MAVPTGWEHETRRYVEDAVNSVKADFDSVFQAMNDKADQVGREERTCLPRIGQRREDGHRAGGRAHSACHRVDRYNSRSVCLSS